MTEAAAGQIRLVWSMEHLASDHCTDSTVRTLAKHMRSREYFDSAVETFGEHVQGMNLTLRTLAKHMRSGQYIDSTVGTIAEKMWMDHRTYSAVETVDEHIGSEYQVNSVVALEQRSLLH